MIMMNIGINSGRRLLSGLTGLGGIGRWSTGLRLINRRGYNLSGQNGKYQIGGWLREEDKEKSRGRVWDGEEEEGEGYEEEEVSGRYFNNEGNFVDVRKILAVGGKGGDGVVSFHRDKLTAQGPPDGGNGGHGGNVVIRSSLNESTLSMVKHRCAASKGLNGRGKTMHGHRGEDLILTVPVGTVVREVDPPLTKDDSGERLTETDQYINQVTELEEDFSPYYRIYPSAKKPVFQFPTPRAIKAELKFKPKIFLDLAEEGEHVLALGGRGGYGNPHFSTREERGALFAERGLVGEQRYFELEFKTLADCGLVGLPNAGKSTFLKAVSNAHPKIAPYPFTTINPYLGTIDYPDLFQLTLADIPGLIPGAHQNKGLGHAFLRHIERSKVLVYVVDLSRPTPHLDFRTLQEELELYQPGLTSRPSLVLANKADIPTVGPNTLSEFTSNLPSHLTVVPVSAKLEKNVRRATAVMRQLVTTTITKPSSPTPIEPTPNSSH